MEREQPRINESNIEIISSRKEISGESFQISCPGREGTLDVYRMGSMWRRFNNDSSQKIGMEDDGQMNEYFLNLVNKSQLVLVPTRTDGQSLAKFYADFAEKYQNAYGLGTWAQAREKMASKTYAVGGYIDDSSMSPGYLANLRQVHREACLGEQKKGINFYVISNIDKTNSVHDVVKHFAKYLDSKEGVSDSLSIYSRKSDKGKKLEHFISEQSNFVKAGIKINLSEKDPRDYVDIAVAVGDVYLGLSNYETYSPFLYKSIGAGRGLILPSLEAGIEMNGSESDERALYMNPLHTPTVITAMKKIINGGDFISRMMINNIKRGEDFSKQTYLKRMGEAATGKIPSIYEI